jgi:aspartokinase
MTAVRSHDNREVIMSLAFPADIDADAINITAEVAVILVEQRIGASLFDLAGKVLSAAAYADASVLALSQSSACGNFSFVVPREDGTRVRGVLGQQLWDDLKRGDIQAPRLIDEVVMITLRTQAHHHSTGLYERLAAHGLNILMISHTGASVTLVIQASLAQARTALSPLALERTHSVVINKQ